MANLLRKPRSSFKTFISNIEGKKTESESSTTFKVGDKVVVTANTLGTPVPLGTTGTIVYLSDDSDSILVCLDGWMEGHDGYGRIPTPPYEKRRSHWFVLPSTIRKTSPLKWKVGAKFKRPEGHTRGGEILTVMEITNQYSYRAVWAVEDGLHTRIEECTLVSME